MVSSRTGRAQLAVLDEPSGGPDREGSGHRIDAGVEPGDVGHVEAVARLGEQLLEVGVARARRSGWRCPTDGRRAVGAARRARRGLAPGAPRGARRRRGSVSSRAVLHRAASGGWQSPRRRTARWPGPSGSVAVVHQLEAPGRPPPRPRGRRTASGRAGPRRADSIPPMNATNDAATNASSTTGQRRLSGCRAPTSASARSAASRADRLRVELRPGRGPSATPRPVIRSAPSPANADA